MILIIFRINNNYNINKINQVIKNKEMLQILNKLKDKEINKKELMEIIKTQIIQILINQKSKVI